MGRQQFRLLVCSATAIALLAGSLLAIPWFQIDLLGSSIEIDLQSASACNVQHVCMSVPLSKLNGLYPATATVSFYGGLLLLLVVIVQSASKIVTGAVHDRVTRIGYILAVATIICGFSAGYLFGPDGTGISTAIKTITVDRTWAPFAFLLGTLSSFAALYYASSELMEDVAEYKPVQIDRRLPVTPLTNKAVTRGSGSIPLEGTARNTRPPTQPSLDRRPITPSGGLRTVDLRSKSPSSPPSSPPSRSSTPSTGLRTDDLRTKSPSSPARSLTPGGSFARTDAQGRSLTPGGGFARTDVTPTSGFARDATTPGGGFVRIEDNRARPPTQPPTDTRSRPATQPPFARTDDTQTRTRPGTQPPFARVDDTQTRTRAGTQPPFARVDDTQTRTRPGTQPPFPRVDDTQTRTRPGTQPPFARVDDTRTKAPSQPPANDPARTKTSSQQPFVARTTSPSGIADASRTKTSSQQPFVARTTSPSGIADGSRTKTSSQQPFVARTTSPSGIADPTRSRSPSQPQIDPVVRARTSSSGPIDLAARLSASVPNPLDGAPNLAVSIRPPLPTPEPVPPDQIPVDPAAGLTIRKRTASAAPHSEMTLMPVTPPRGEIAVTPVMGLPVTAPALSPSPLTSSPLTSSPLTPSPLTSSPLTPSPLTPPRGEMAVDDMTLGPMTTPASRARQSTPNDDLTLGALTSSTKSAPVIVHAPMPVPDDVTLAPMTSTTSGSTSSSLYSDMTLAPSDHSSPAASARPSSPALPDHAFAPPVAIPTPPESGLLIRQRRPSAAPPVDRSAGDAAMPGITVDGFENLAEALEIAAQAAAAATATPTATATATATPTATATSAVTATPTAAATGTALPTATTIGTATATPAATATPTATNRDTTTAAATVTTGTATKPHELPDYIRGKINFAVITAELARAGIKARREDGLEKLVPWDELVGIVARRLPAEKPFEGATVVDLLSTAGSTLRIVPWTRLDGHPFESKAVERARSLVNVVAAMALDAKLDSATKMFANGDGDAAQLPSVAALATHDSRVG